MTFGVGVALTAAAFPSSSIAADAQATGRTDPHANSPAGAIYQIPIDSGRRDGAPVPTGRGIGGSDGSGAGGASGGTGGGSGGGAGGDGSSGGDGATRAASGPGGGTAENPSSIHSENGFGSSSHVPGVSDSGVPTLANSQIGGSEGVGSSFGTYALLALAAIMAIMCGVGAAGRLRH